MRIFRYMKKYWFFAILAPLFMVGEVLMDLVQPLLMAEIVDVHLINGDIEQIILTGLKMLGLVFLGGCFGILSGVFTNLAAFKYSNDMRQDVFRHVVNLSFEQTDNFTTGSLVTRITNDITQVTNIVSMSMRMLIRTFMQFAGGIVALLTINPKFSNVLLYILPVLLVAIVIILAIISPKFSIMQSRVDDVNAVVQENVTGARVVKAYTAEEKETKRFEKANQNLFDINWKVFKTMSIMSPFMSVCIYVALVSIMYIGGKDIVAGSGLEVGDLTAAISYITMILFGFMMLAMFAQTIVRGTASIKRLNAVLDTNPVVNEGQVEETEEIGTVEFKDVDFIYPGSSGEKVLSNINLKVNTYSLK